MEPHSSSTTRPSASSIFFSGGAYFIHFLALGFASFPLQTHLRQVLAPTSASLVASVVPIAACSTYFLFRFAEARGWTRSPQWMLVTLASALSIMQATLGMKLHWVSGQSYWIGPAIDVAACLLVLGCIQSSCMTVLNHIGVAAMGSHAYTVRAAGSAGYMVAVMLMGLLGGSQLEVSERHLFVGSACSAIHAIFAALSFLFVRWTPAPSHLPTDSSSPNAPTASTGVSTAATPSRASHSHTLEWWCLLALVWMIAMCEMSYGLYSHEFLTSTYGAWGYFVFATAIAMEIGLLLAMPRLNALKQRLLFVGPLGWICLFTGCLLAIAGWYPMGYFALALALNCPFQVSANEHAHRMKPSIMGVASMTLAQSLGYVTATLVAAWTTGNGNGPQLLWMTMWVVSIIALILALWKMNRDRIEAASLK
jgi:hypothetical protein